MIQTRIWAPILIATVLVGGLLLVTAIESADAKPAKRAFGFGGSTPNIIMAGDGDWTKMTTKIKAKGVFTLTASGDSGKWKAITLTDVSSTCPPCTTTGTGPNNVAFTAKFKTQAGNEFTWDVVVSTGDIRVGNDPTFENFWVQTKGFGPAIPLFFDK